MSLREVYWKTKKLDWITDCVYVGVVAILGIYGFVTVMPMLDVADTSENIEEQFGILVTVMFTFLVPWLLVKVFFVTKSLLVLFFLRSIGRCQSCNHTLSKHEDKHGKVFDSCKRRKCFCTHFSPKVVD